MRTSNDELNDGDSKNKDEYFNDLIRLYHQLPNIVSTSDSGERVDRYISSDKYKLLYFSIMLIFFVWISSGNQPLYLRLM